MEEQAKNRRGAAKRAVQVVMTGVVMAVALFLPAGRFQWWQAWVFLGIYFAAIAFTASVSLRGDAALMAERAETKENTKHWDKVLMNFMTVMTLATLVVAGFDARWGWSGVPTAISAAGLVLVVMGFGLVSWGMAANRFFARVVRLQADRGQRVCSAGPYRFVRHPGYLGMILYSLAMAFGLGSWWAVLPAALVAVAFVVRTALEDRTLQAELPGYPEYAARVRYRLIPGLW